MPPNTVNTPMGKSVAFPFAQPSGILSLVITLLSSMSTARSQTSDLMPAYNIQDQSGNAMDVGFAYAGRPSFGNFVYLYSYNNGMNQQFTFTSDSRLQSVTHTDQYLYDAGGFLAVGSNGDTFTIVAADGGSGYTIQDNSDGGLYISSPGAMSPPNKLSLSSTTAAWLFRRTSLPTRIDDTDASVVYSLGNNLEGGPITNWSRYQGGEDYEGTQNFSNFRRSGPSSFQGASVAITFNGTAITWIGKKGPDYGVAAVMFDGVPYQTFDAYNSSDINQSPNVSVSGEAAGSHVLQISLLAEKNPASTDFYQTIDAFQMNGSALPLSSGTVAGYDSPQLFYSSGWQCGGGPTDLSRGHCWSNVAGSYLSWSFTGSLIEVYGRPDLENGYFQVYIDGNYVTSVDGHFGNADDDALNAVLLYARKLTSGPHTIQLVVAGMHDDQGTNNYVQIDQLVAFP